MKNHHLFLVIAASCWCFLFSTTFCIVTTNPVINVVEQNSSQKISLINVESNKIRYIVKLLEDCADEKQHFKCFITYELAKDALNEVENWDCRSGIRLKRAEPSIYCAEWLLRPLVAYGKEKLDMAWKKMQQNHKLFRNQCKFGLIDYYIAHGELMQNLASALFWDVEKAPKLSDELFRRAKMEFDIHINNYYNLESNKENFHEIEWTLQYMNSRAARIIMRKIMPLYESGNVSAETLRDIFTDEMRLLGNFVESGEQHYFNYDIDIVPIF